MVSKSELKRRQKKRLLDEKRAVKEQDRVAQQAAKGESADKKDAVDEQAMMPSQYFDYRKQMVQAIPNAYPHKFHVSMEVA